MTAFLRGCFIAALCTGIGGCADEALLSPLNWVPVDRPITVTEDIAYGTSPRQHLDVYAPSDADGAPLVLFWYGGSWQHGAKGYYAFVGERLAAEGFVAIVPDYRLAPDHPFPSFVEDAAAAVRWAHEHAEEFGGDPDRLYVSGHSAGGHSALMLALDPIYLDAVGMKPSDLAGVMSLAGPTGLENLRGPSLAGVFPATMPDDAFSPITLASRSARDAPRILLMIGLDDDVIYASSIARLADAIREGQGSVSVKTYPDLGHLGLILGFSHFFNSDVARDMARFANLL